MKNSVFEHIDRASKYTSRTGPAMTNHGSMVAIAKMMVKESSKHSRESKLKTKPKKLGYFPY